MPITEQVRIEITAKANDAVKELAKTETAASKLGDTLKKAFAAGAVLAAVKKFADFMKDASEAAAIQEAAVTRLSAALTVTGQASDGALSDMTAFASELQRLTVIGDEVSIGLMQTAINMGLTGEEAKTATRQAIALSRAYGIDLNTAMIGVVNTMKGQASTLTRYIPSLKAATDATDRMAILNREAEKAWAIATAEVNTAAGALTQLQNALGDTKELIGQTLNNDLTPFRQELTEIVIKLNEWISAGQTAAAASKAFADGNATASQSAQELTRKIEAMEASLKRMQELNQGSAAEPLKAQLEILKKQQEYYQGIADREERIASSRNSNNAAAEKERSRLDAERKTAASILADAEKLAEVRSAANNELAANASRTAELFAGEEQKRLQALADRQNAETEAFYAEQDHIRQLAAEEAARHEAKIAQLQADLAAYSGYAGSVGQIFSNLIQSQMSGEEELSDRKKRNIIALFRIQQAANIAQIGVDTAAAILRQFKDLPFPAAIATSAIIGALGATQIGLVAATKPPVALADGGIVMPTPGGTQALIAEAGRPEAVIPLDRLGSLGTIVVNVYGSVGSQEDVATWVYEGITRARQMGKVA